MDGENPQWGMTELEERLRAPEGPEARAEMLSRLSQLSEQLDAMTARGLRPDDFERASAMRAAVETARRILAAMS